jgi:serine/threonine protein kinase
MSWDIPIGTEFAGYRITGVLGRGGMSVVYTAEHVGLGRTVALKLLSASLAGDQSFRDRFGRESRLAATLDHANIIPIYDAGEAEGFLYIAMRHVEGYDLGTLLEQEGPLPLGQTLFYMEQVAGALDQAHEQGLIHRDVKPGNILIARPSDRVFLTDFGVVKEASSQGLTKTGYFLGTFAYAAPEQIEGRPVDARTDVYALGCVLYECLSGQPPFDAETEGSIIHAHLVEPPPRLTAKRPDLPIAINDVIATAMAKSMEDRYSSCGEFIRALRAVALGTVSAHQRSSQAPPTVQAAPETTLSPAVEAFPPPPAEATPPTAALEVPVSHPQREPLDSVPARRYRDRFGTRRSLIVLAVALAGAGALAGFLLTRGSGGGSHTPGRTIGMPESSAKPGAFPDAIESELVLAHIPSDIRPTCKRIASIAPGVFLRSVKCSQGASAGFVTYNRAHSGDSMRAYLLGKVADQRLRYPTKWACRDRRPAADEWLREGTQTHVEGPSRQAEGRVLCYENASTSSIVWTDTPTKLVASASRPVGDWSGLYSWWRTAAGPEKELGMSHVMKATGHYPDAIERELLLDHLPTGIRKTCVRSDAFDHDVFLRAVECSQGMTGMKVKYMYAHSGTAMKEFSNNQITRAGLNPPDPLAGTAGTCKDNVAAADTWVRSDDIIHLERLTRSSEGRVLCYVAAGDAVIEWTDTPTGIYAVASRPAGERRALYAWWRGKAGPGALEMTSMQGSMTP